MIIVVAWKTVAACARSQQRGNNYFLPFRVFALPTGSRRDEIIIRAFEIINVAFVSKISLLAHGRANGEVIISVLTRLTVAFFATGGDYFRRFTFVIISI